MIKLRGLIAQVVAWHPKTDIPAQYGEYMVLGLRTGTPDHNGDPDSVWEIMFATYSPCGWSTKIKCWSVKPDPPEEYRKLIGKVTHFNKVRW